MKLEESGNYLFITIEPNDWRTFGKRLLDTLKCIPGSQYLPNKSWKINKSRKHLLGSLLPPFTIEEELEGEAALKEFLDQFSENYISYSL